MERKAMMGHLVGEQKLGGLRHHWGQYGCCQTQLPKDRVLGHAKPIKLCKLSRNQ